MVWQQGQQVKQAGYCIQKVISTGGHGITYLAKTGNGERVVIKTLLDEWVSDLDLQRTFRDEAQVLALCRHDHVVTIVDTFWEGDRYCIVLDYIEGQDLERWVLTQGCLSEERALRYIRQAGTALTLVHHKGLLHRDIKPANIMVAARQEQAIVIDFGLARHMLHRSRSALILGTEGYAPIEQYDEEARLGCYTDIYALAATLYYLVTAQPPLTSSLRLVRDLPEPIHLNPQISERLNQGILWGMAIYPQDRPQQMEQWIESLPISDLLAQSESTKPLKQRGDR